MFKINTSFVQILIFLFLFLALMPTVSVQCVELYLSLRRAIYSQRDKQWNFVFDGNSLFFVGLAGWKIYKILKKNNYILSSNRNILLKRVET